MFLMTVLTKKVIITFLLFLFTTVEFIVKEVTIFLMIVLAEKTSNTVFVKMVLIKYHCVSHDGAR